MDSKCLVAVNRQSGFATSPIEELVNNHIYPGVSNDINFYRSYTTSFVCSFNMDFYPFDVQECHMTFMLRVRGVLHSFMWTMNQRV